MTTVEGDTASAERTGPAGAGRSAPDRPRRARRAPQRPVAVLLALAFFFVPAAAFGIGERAQEIENRRLTALPSVSDGWDFFDHFTAWAVDHMPLRDDAVRGNAALSERVFGEPPSYDTGESVAGIPGVGGAQPPAGPETATTDRVVQGRDGWLYLGSDFSLACDPAWTVADTIARAGRLARAVEASGRRFVLTVAPNKSTAWPQQLPADYRGKNCAAPRREAFWTALRSTPPRGYLDLLGPIRSAQAAAGRAAYLRIDTHWDELGAAVYARELAERLRPGLTRGTRLVPAGTVKRGGDLSVVLGRPDLEDAPVVRVDRPGVLPGPDADAPKLTGQPARITHSTTGVPLFRPRTLLLGDSFSDAARRKVAPFFADLTVLRFDASGRVMASAMVDSDVVVVEIVERSLNGGEPPVLSPGNLSAFEAALRANPRR